ncbi:unnamed protein product [Rotaria sp. Silwood2]|nr:unnamed protein product [Rotaria sp. Silwood2]
MFQCSNSLKFISKHRLVDGRRDCHNNDDEIADACTIKNEYRFQCSKKDINNNKSICILPFRVMDGFNGCPDGENNKIRLLIGSMVRQNLSAIDFKNFWSSDHILSNTFFPSICNGIKQTSPMLINEEYHSDETECEDWPCNNIYSRCDTFWSCKNGMDELNCKPSQCPPLHHACVSPKTLKLDCLPIYKAGDNIMDCLGGTDELQQCQVGVSTQTIFQCGNVSKTTCLRIMLLCDKKNDCLFGDDEKFCQNYMTGFMRLCSSNVPNFNRSKEEEFFCGLTTTAPKIKTYFILSSQLDYTLPFESQKEHKFQQKTIVNENNFVRTNNFTWAQQCKRGLRVHVNSEDNNTYKCFCPPAYYGNTCEYQNQRVSITIQIRAIAYWQTMFSIVLLLINNNDQTIESYAKIEFISIQDCGIKYHINLLYSTRPKDESRNYSIRIDVFDRHSMEYRGSWDYPIVFPFLPVNRMAIILVIPAHQLQSTCNTLNCGSHGQCLLFMNSDRSFCKCNDGWSGKGCMIAGSSKFHCAPNSLSVGTNRDRPICVCPLGKFGSRCYLKHPSCPDNMCKNGGTCIVRDERMPSWKPICICMESYSGTNCATKDTKIDISFEKLPIPSAILFHFITAHGDKPESRVTSFKKIAVDQMSTTIYISTMFHLIFVEFFDTLYFAHLQYTYTAGEIIKTTIKPHHQCRSIDELLSANVNKLHKIRRVKHYPIICQQHANLSCFYDDSYICFCYNNHTTPNCFSFKHNMTYNCQGYNYCQNGGRCFQNDIVCPTSSICECKECFYGSRCQFTSKGFGLSLDLILGPHIRPYNYSFVIQISTLIVSLLTLIGFINAILSVITFQTKNSRNSSSGLYLLSSSITSIFIIIFFSLKCWLLILSQKRIITNRSIVSIQCLLIDFLLRISLNMENWLNVCVSIERVIIIIKGVQFNNIKSKQISKKIVFVLLFFNIITTIQEPISRRLVDDEEDQRTWCIIEYSPFLKIFNSLFYLFHFLTPFLVHLISALIIIIRLAQKRNISRPDQKFRKTFRKKLNEHKHLLVGPIVLIVLSLPRLVILFLPGCMKSFREPWLFLLGYFVSFIPALVSFVTFVLPSNMYKKEFSFTFSRIKQLFFRNY